MAVSVGNLVLFIGGVKDSLHFPVVSDVIDIYNLNTGNWSVAHMSTPRYLVTPVVSGNKIFIGGGLSKLDWSSVTATVDVFTAE